MARNMAIDYGMPVALFSLEMASVQLITVSSETGFVFKENCVPGSWKSTNGTIEYEG
jgi:replicative DNA helicase